MLQTGEYDYAWNLQVEDEVLKRLETGGKGRVDVVYGGNLEFLLLNATDPNVEIDGERASITTKHPAFSDPKVCQAINLLVDRKSIQTYIYGAPASPRPTRSTAPSASSRRTRASPSIRPRPTRLDEAGWAKGSDGIRARMARSSSSSSRLDQRPRQKTQAIIKQAAAKAGIEIELKSVTGSVFFSSDPANPDNYSHFYADMECTPTT